MKLSDLRIIADDRERKSRIPNFLKKLGVHVELTTLAVGDYIVAHETTVERKTIQDFITSVFDGRLFDQCERLKQHYENSVIIIEGDLNEIEEIVENPLVFYGAVSSTVLDYKIPVVPTPSAMHSAKLLISMTRRQKTTRGPLLKKIKKSDDLQRQQLTVLCSLPGVGEKLATRILDKFGSLSGFFSASYKELARVEGLSTAKAVKIREILDSTNSNVEESIGQKTLHDI